MVAWACFDEGDHRSAQAHWTEMLTTARADAAKGRIVRALGWLALLSGGQASDTLMHEAEAMSAGVESPGLRAEYLALRGVWLARRGEQAAADARFDAARSQARSSAVARRAITLLARVSSRLNYIPVVSHPHEEPVPWTGRSGFVQDVWTEGLLAEKWGFQPAPGDTHVLLCGHPGMVEAMVAILQGEGFEEHSRKSPGQIHLERYW